MDFSQPIPDPTNTIDLLGASQEPPNDSSPQNSDGGWITPLTPQLRPKESTFPLFKSRFFLPESQIPKRTRSKITFSIFTQDIGSDTIEETSDVDVEDNMEPVAVDQTLPVENPSQSQDTNTVEEIVEEEAVEPKNPDVKDTEATVPLDESLSSSITSSIISLTSPSNLLEKEMNGKLPTFADAPKIFEDPKNVVVCFCWLFDFSKILLLIISFGLQKKITRQKTVLALYVVEFRNLCQRLRRSCVKQQPATSIITSMCTVAYNYRKASMEIQLAQAELENLISDAQAALRNQRPISLLNSQECCESTCSHMVASFGACCGHGYCETHRATPYKFVRNLFFSSLFFLYLC